MSLFEKARPDPDDTAFREWCRQGKPTVPLSDAAREIRKTRRFLVGVFLLAVLGAVVLGVVAATMVMGGTR